MQVRKLTTALAAGLVLFAAQVAAAADNAVVKLGDRIGSPSKTSQKLMGSDSTGLLMLVAAAAGVAAVIYIGERSTRQDRPTSP